MIVISFDFETYSEAPLGNVGAWRYAHDPTTRILCCAWSEGGGAPQLWVPGDELPAWVRNPDGYHFRAWNSFFEYCIWSACWPSPPPDFEHWTDTAAEAAALGLPRALGACGAVFNLGDDKAKSERGKYLIDRLCMPNRYKPPETKKQLLQELYDYCRQDVVAEMALADRLLRLSDFERRVWIHDQRVNWRGVPVDIETVDNAVAVAEKMQARLRARCQELTDGTLTSTSGASFLGYIRGLGYNMPNYQKSTVLEWLDKTEGVAHELLQNRLDGSKTSVSKFKALAPLADIDGRAHGLLMYYGAHTGRWAGRHFQPQNLTSRNIFKDSDTVIKLLRYRSADVLDMAFGDTMKALSSSVRGMIRAPRGKKLVVADYHAIEACVLAWDAGEAWKVEAINEGRDLYVENAIAFGLGPGDAGRFAGKTTELACGYQGGLDAVLRMADALDIDFHELSKEVSADTLMDIKLEFAAPGHWSLGRNLSDAEAFAEHVKRLWREKNPHIQDLWYRLDQDSMLALQNPDTRFGPFKVVNGFMFFELPSGRLLSYPAARLRSAQDIDPQVIEDDRLRKRREQKRFSYLGTRSRTITYGGKLTENRTQAIARDLLADAMLRLEENGYHVILSVHDEIVAEVSESFGSEDEFVEIMCDVPEWAKGIPVKATGYEAERYRK